MPAAEIVGETYGKLKKSEEGMTALHIAAKCGNVNACYHILNATHLPLRYIDSVDDGGWTPMVWASEFNHVEVVKFLMSKGANSLIKDIEQNIALHWAAFGGSMDIMELYLNDGSDVNAVNVHGDTPLHIASRQDMYDCVLLLVARGARSDIKNKKGYLPRDCSVSEDSDIYKVLTLNMEINCLLTKYQGRSLKIICNDISRGKERIQIQCVNGVDDEELPQNYVYVSENVFTSKISIDRTINSLECCKCTKECNAAGCECSTVSVKCWYDTDGKLKPDFNYTDPPMIFECNQACLCNRITCQNRVIQNGITCRFQLFRTENKGWGIRTLNLIPKGTYVCEYVGEIISDCEADHREDDSYLFDLDNREGETFCIDARHYGNFARFINHMCTPNLTPVHVFVDHQDLHFPRIAFFANRDIEPDEELGYNYGEKFWVIKWKSFTCTCGAGNCMYSESTIKTTLENYQKKLAENS